MGKNTSLKTRHPKPSHFYAWCGSAAVWAHAYRALLRFPHAQLPSALTGKVFCLKAISHAEFSVHCVPSKITFNLSSLIHSLLAMTCRYHIPTMQADYSLRLGNTGLFFRTTKLFSLYFSKLISS